MLSIGEQHELLQVIDEESDRLNRFIEGLSTTDREEPMQRIHMRTVRLEDVVRAGLARAETVTRDHNVTISIDDTVPDVRGDAASITEVIYILLDNASKYSPAGSYITLRAERHNDRYLRVAVSDEGPGIPAELRERVFEKFFRVPGRESHDRRRGGIGLGLPIARRLIEAHGGEIWIDAAGGRGTTVRLTLPAVADVVEPERMAAATAGD